MPIKTPTLKPAKKMVVHAVSTPLPYAHYQRCTQCDMLFRLPVLKRNQSAWCPRCNAKVRDGRDWSLTRLGSMAVAMLLLMPLPGRTSAAPASAGRAHRRQRPAGDLADDRAGRSAYRRDGAVLRGGRPGAAGGLDRYLWLGNVLGMNLRPVLLMLASSKSG
jgi:paraquat-inducible protein A